MRCAAFAPTRGSIASCAASAVLGLTIPVIGAATGCESAAMAAPEMVAMRITDRTMRWDFRMVFFSLIVGGFFVPLIHDTFRFLAVSHTRTVDPLHQLDFALSVSTTSFRGPVVRSNG